MARRPLSLQARSLLAAGVVLVAFLGLAGVALDQAIYRTLLKSLHDRLQSYAYGYLATSEVSRSGRWTPPEVSPDSRLDSPESGLYASVVGPVEVDGARFPSWRSQSAYAITDIPQFDETLKPGAERFTDAPVGGASGKVYIYSYGFSWEKERGPVLLTIHIAESAANFEAQRNVFRRSLVFTFGGLVIGLLLLLLGLLRWILQPARRIAVELGRVERGDQERLSTDYPLELRRLSGSINDFIDSERNSLKRYRNTLSDLAHSLKTPLAVIRSQLETGAEGKEFRWTVLEPSQETDLFLRAARAVTADEWLEIMRSYVAPTQNGLVADRKGSIGIRSAGWYPIRPGDGRGDRIFDGSTGASDWTGMLPVERYPQALRPA